MLLGKINFLLKSRPTDYRGKNISDKVASHANVSTPFQFLISGVTAQTAPSSEAQGNTLNQSASHPSSDLQ